MTTPKHRLLVGLAALFHDVGKPATREQVSESKVRFLGHENVGADIAFRVLTQQLRFPVEIAEKVARIVRLHMSFKGDAKPSSMERVARRFAFEAKTPDVVAAALDVMQADDESHAEGWNKSKVPAFRAILTPEFIAYAQSGVLPVDGHDALAMGLKGPQIGAALAAVRKAWFHSGPRMTRKEAMGILFGHAAEIIKGKRS